MAEMDIQAIMEILPHRYPFLLVDRILECDDERRIVGLKNLSITEPFFQGHFPGRPIMPGVMQVEAMAQVGGILLNRVGKRQGMIALFTSIDRARFRRMLVPGDQMRMEIEILRMRTKLAKVHGKILVDGELASEAEMMFAFE